MKTVIWSTPKRKEIIFDGHRIIIAFGDAVIDPVETAKVVDKKIIDTKEGKDLLSKSEAHAKKIAAATACFMEGADLLRRRKEKESDAKAAEYRGLYAEAEALQKPLRDLKPVLRELRKQLRRECAVYFEPKFGERIISDEEHQRLFELLENRAPDELISIEGEVVINPDYVTAGE